MTTERDLAPEHADCRFCQVHEERPRWAVKHGRDVLSWKPFGALNKGHRMFVPRVHVRGAGEVPVVTARLFEVAAEWGGARGEDFNLHVNSGVAAGQTVSHLHVHYVPRQAGDGLLQWRPA